jgi:hypothetical protein
VIGGSAGPAARRTAAVNAAPVRLRLTRRGRFVLTTLAAAPLVALAVFGTLAAGSAYAVGRAPAGVTQHVVAHDAGEAGAVVRHAVVRPGDSLWSIARRTAPQSDPRIVVREIAVLNNLTSTVLTPGESLAVPAGV